MISIIVPVYNVEKYLNRCIDSILKQIYIDFEIILVNDGSTDSSGIICEYYHEQYPQIITVIHQNNQGLSQARNTGLEQAKGEYITFIDSDDFISPNYLYVLLKNMKMYDADISCCSYIRTTKSIMNNDFIKSNNICTIVEGSNCVKFYLEKELVSAGIKLYKKEIFNNLRFPFGKIHEDISTIFQAFSQARRIVYIDEKLYYYYKNFDGITKQRFNIKQLDLINAWKDVMKFSEVYEKNIQDVARFRLNKSYFTLLGKIALYGYDKAMNEIERKKILNFIMDRFECYELITSKYMPFSRKFSAIAFKVNFSFCCNIGRLLRVITDRNQNK
ncbi:glycosyltransferase [uncultured Phascolarctobacterium sp.]|uniref:glycosyltransferase family 2 protein n=1 Tax=uncultured Phascolarctobacterium sp. TaxID=512296 RepID=UPI0025FE9109|nr:glycosyltransferase [uncultured Phascolarctobacterium sp.]